MTAMERLWIDHVLWTRAVIISAVAGLPDKDAALRRLLQNQNQIGRALGSDLLATLLREHIQIAVALVAAASRGDRGGAAAADARWHRNADALATELARLTGKPAAAIKQMLYDHLALTGREAAARIVGRWDADIASFDRVLTQAIHMADSLGGASS